MNSLMGIKIVENKYLPDGFVQMTDADGDTILNTKTGEMIRIPRPTYKIRYELSPPLTHTIQMDWSMLAKIKRWTKDDPKTVQTHHPQNP